METVAIGQVLWSAFLVCTWEIISIYQRYAERLWTWTFPACFSSVNNLFQNAYIAYFCPQYWHPQIGRKKAKMCIFLCEILRDCELHCCSRQSIQKLNVTQWKYLKIEWWWETYLIRSRCKIIWSQASLPSLTKTICICHSHCWPSLLVPASTYIIFLDYSILAKENMKNCHGDEVFNVLLYFKNCSICYGTFVQAIRYCRIR